MTIKLKRCISEANRLTKSFTANSEKSYDGTFRDPENILTPVFTIETADDLTLYNYAEIAAFGRKYFAKITAAGYHLWEIACTVDVLSSFADGIKASYGIVKRTEKQSMINWYMNDGALFTEQRQIITHHTFKKSGVNATLGTDSYYLLVAGGA